MIKFLKNLLWRSVLCIRNIISLSYMRMFNIVRWFVGCITPIKLLTEHLNTVKRWLIGYLKNVKESINFNIVRLKLVRIFKKVKDSYFILKKTKNLIYGIIKDIPLFIFIYNFAIHYLKDLKNGIILEQHKSLVAISFYSFRYVERFPHFFQRNHQLDRELKMLSIFISVITISCFIIFISMSSTNNDLILYSSVIPSKIEIKNIKLRLKFENLIKKITKHIKSLTIDQFNLKRELNNLIYSIEKYISNNDQKLISAPENFIVDSNVKVITIYRSPENKHIRLHVSGLRLTDELNSYETSLKKLFNSITSNEDFIKLSPIKKVLITGYESIDPSVKRSLHKSVTITNKTLFKDYYINILEHIQKYWNGQSMSDMDVVVL
jgi:hypothetical protein